MKYFFLLLALFSTTVIHADETSYVREYTYKASDLDSKVSARKNTLNLIKAGVLDEIISYIHNSNSIEQAQVNDQFRSSFIQNTTSSSAGFLKARVLQEHWNGFEMRIKAQIKADPERIRNELEKALALKPANATQSQQQPSAQAAPQAIAMMNTAPDYSRYMRSLEFTQVIVLLQPLKITMLEHYSMYDEWPSTFKQLHLNPDDMNDGKFVDQIKLGKDGLIFAFLSSTFGKDKYLSLQPKSIMGGMNIRWECVTNLSKKKINNQVFAECIEDKNMSYN